MDKLEQYLEQVCRRIGGPRSLRQHIREELREHLCEAAAEHQAAGMSETEALDRALTDFGGPDQVRSELEETHGHRLLPVVIDQAMRWKEMTMRARWLWTTWAYLAAIAVILADLFFIGFTTVYELPKLQKIYADGWIADDSLGGPSLRWMYSFLERIGTAWNQVTWWLFLALVGWGVFEWRVRSENKPFMRLAGLGTAAVALSVIVALTGIMMPLMFMVGLPQTFQLPQRVAGARLKEIDSLIAAMEEARAKKDWPGVERNADQARYRIEGLSYVAPAIMIPPSETKKDELRTQLTSAKASLGEAILAGQAQDAERLESAIQRFQRAYGSIRATQKEGEK